MLQTYYIPPQVSRNLYETNPVYSNLAPTKTTQNLNTMASNTTPLDNKQNGPAQYVSISLVRERGGGIYLTLRAAKPSSLAPPESRD